MTTPVHFGPFLVRERIGVGGFGEIYRAVHQEAGLEVAIKVVTAEVARHPSYLNDFRREVRAVAGLDHPNIVQVFDYGTIPSKAAAALPRLVAGSPYLVMELASGSVADLPMPMAWQTCRMLLHDLLSALGHAHSRGLVHRDIKPGNTLLVDGREGRIVRLSDFGIAQNWGVKDGGVELDAAVGTPFYMAPEQFAARWRDFGPWTDLYQVGIFAFEMAFGVYPFQADTFMGFGLQHLRAPLPRMPVPAGYPAGFGDWLQTMCAKETRRRFASAAEAGWALAALEDMGRPEPDAEGRGRTEFGVFRRRRADLGAFEATLGGRIDGGGQTLMFDPSLTDSLADHPVQQEPTTHGIPWQPAPIEGQTGSAGARLGSVGAGLFGLRTIPIVGREAIQQQLWAALRKRHLKREPAAALLGGSAGVGKSRLAAWLTDSATELGLASSVVIRSGPEEGSGLLGRTVAERYRCNGLKRLEARLRLEQVLAEEGVTDRAEVEGLVALVSEGLAGVEPPESSARTIRFGSPLERQAVFEQLLRRAAARQPVLVWLDDAHFGGEALAAMVSIARQARDLPLLTLVTFREDLLEDRPVERALLEELAAHSASTTIIVPPLDEEAQHELVARMLGLSGALAASIRMRAAGNPLFAVQLVGDLIARGELVGRPGGFSLRTGITLRLPNDVRSLWLGRIEQVVSESGPDVKVALELAALLGVSVDGQAFAELSRRVGLIDGSALLGSVAGTGLIEQTSVGWRLAHPLLRDTLEREARTRIDWMDWNHACAEALTTIYDRGMRGLSARRAGYLAEALAWDEALEAITEAVAEALHAGETLPIPELLDRQSEILDALRVPSCDPRRAEALLTRAEAYRLQWNFGAAAEWADLALAAADRASSPRLRGEAYLCRMHIARQQGDSGQAEVLATEALTTFRTLDDGRGLGRTYLGLAILLRTQGRITEALGNYERALAEFVEIGDEVSAARCRLGVAHLHRGQGRHRQALALYETALERFECEGVRNEVIQARVGLAEVARFEGRLEEARQAYEEALGLQRAIGDRSLSITRCNLALVALSQRQFAGARRQLELAETEMIQAGQRGTLVYVQVLLLACIAAAGEKALWERQLAAAAKALEETGTVDLDLAKALELAGALMMERGLKARARDGWRLALAQFKKLEDEKGAARIGLLLVSTES